VIGIVEQGFAKEKAMPAIKNARNAQNRVLKKTD
jgi:hypothetical protein